MLIKEASQIETFNSHVWESESTIESKREVINQHTCGCDIYLLKCQMREKGYTIYVQRNESVNWLLRGEDGACCHVAAH